jgi:serpin B
MQLADFHVAHRFLAALLVVISLMSPFGARVAGADESAAGAGPAVVEDLVRANNRFAIDLFRKLSANTTQNAFFSPYSVSTALAMTWAGARTQTADQMATVLHLSDLPRASITSAFHGLQQALVQTNQQTGAELSIANSLWPEKEAEHPILPQYLKLVQDDFASSVQPFDFRSNAEQARQQINRWVEDKTHDKIKDLLHQGDIDAASP